MNLSDEDIEKISNLIVAKLILNKEPIINEFVKALNKKKDDLVKLQIRSSR